MAENKDPLYIISGNDTWVIGNPPMVGMLCYQFDDGEPHPLLGMRNEKFTFDFGNGADSFIFRDGDKTFRLFLKRATP
jgi:hypothetical protein